MAMVSFIAGLEIFGTARTERDFIHMVPGSNLKAGFSFSVHSSNHPAVGSMRNIRCPQYVECLDAAIDLGMDGFECDGCRHARAVGPVDPCEIEGAIMLLWAIFRPALYRAVRGVETMERSSGR